MSLETWESDLNESALMIPIKPRGMTIWSLIGNTHCQQFLFMNLVLPNLISATYKNLELTSVAHGSLVLSFFKTNNLSSLYTEDHTPASIQNIFLEHRIGSNCDKTECWLFSFLF